MIMDNQTKSDILGQVARPPVRSGPKIKGSFKIPEEKLKEPLYYDGTVVRCFCFGCGISTELLSEGAMHLVKKAEADVPLSWEGFYFESEQCIVCAKDFKKAVFKKS